MKCKTRITRADVVITLACMLLLLANIGAVGRSSRRRAKEMVCVSNLLKWGIIFDTYVNDHHGCFMDRGGVVDWIETLMDYSYFRDDRLLLCPEATKGWVEGGRNPFMAWGPYGAGPWGNVVGSYVINLWIANESGSSGGLGLTYWRTPNVVGGSDAPMLLDGQWANMQPYPEDVPLEYETDIWTPNAQEMQRACISRHNGAVNALFIDGSVRKVGLKSLWRLDWSRNWPDDYPLPEWPEWMANFKDP